MLDANGTAPWWTYLVAWIGPGLIGLEVFAPILIGLVPTIMHAIAGSLIGGNTNTLASKLRDHISAPTPDNLALVLDEVDVHETGIQISGRADSGSILAYGRQVAFSTQTGVVLSNPAPKPVYLRFDWKPSIGTIEVTNPIRWAVTLDNAREAFWSATYDDLPADSALTRDPFSISAGETVMVWLEAYETMGGTQKCYLNGHRAVQMWPTPGSS